MTELEALRVLAGSPRFLGLAAAVWTLVANRRGLWRMAKGAAARLWSLKGSLGGEALRTNAAPLALVLLAASMAATQRGCDGHWPLPIPAVVDDGPRQLVILREAMDRSPGLKSLELALRDGPHADYLRAKGHRLLVADDDAVGRDGAAVALVEQLKTQAPLPAAFILDSAGKVLVRRPLPAETTADEVIAWLKGAGG